MYSVFLDGILLPVTPEKITMKIKNKNEAITLMDDTEINILKSPGLTEISFSVLLPQTKYPFAIYANDEFKSADYFLTIFENLKVAKKDFRFIITRVSPAGRLLFDTNLSVSLEDYEIEEDAKEGFDLIVKINLKKYNTYGTKTLTISGDTATAMNVR